MSDEKIVELHAVSKRFENVVALEDVTLEVSSGSIVSLLGPSGCGKTTTLRIIAGFETPDTGQILIAGEDVRGKRPYERNVGLLFQDYALFPHMTVEQNVAYGLRHRGVERKAIAARTREMLDLVHLTDDEQQRRPAQLSGGQQQRVALARALATEPSVMLLDEPLSALDAKLRQELRVELKEILKTVGTTTIVVTHDQDEAMSLAEHVIVMDSGRIMQRGSPTDIYAHPANRFVAEFIGRSNWFNGRLGPATASGLCVFTTDDGWNLSVPEPNKVEAVDFGVCVRPERIVLRATTPASQGDCFNIIRGTVVDIMVLGADVHVTLALASGHRITAITKNLSETLPPQGETVDIGFRVDDCIVLPTGI